jgi:hypothetical protein
MTVGTRVENSKTAVTDTHRLQQTEAEYNMVAQKSIKNLQIRRN